MIGERIECDGEARHTSVVLDALHLVRNARSELGLTVGTWWCQTDRARNFARGAWECAFASDTALAADVTTRAASGKFDAALAHLPALGVRVVRSVGPAKGSTLVAPALPLGVVPRLESFGSGSHELKGHLYLPPGAGPWPVLVFNHTSHFAPGTPDSVQTGVAAVLVSWGVACFAPHRHGYGLSSGPSWRDECQAPEFTALYNQQLLARLEREAVDVVAASSFVRQLREISADRVALVGVSFGAITSVLAASTAAPCRAVIAFAPGAMNWEQNPPLAGALTTAATHLTVPLLIAQAANDFSLRPTAELAAAVASVGGDLDARVFPPFGASPQAGHPLGLFGAPVWAPHVQRFCDRWL